jgi:hypothetical protein
LGFRPTYASINQTDAEANTRSSVRLHRCVVRNSSDLTRSRAMSSTSSWASTTTPAPDLTPPSASADWLSPVLARGLVAAGGIRARDDDDHQDPAAEGSRGRLLLELDTVADTTEAAKMATRHAERRAREAAAKICRLDNTRTSGMQFPCSGQCRVHVAAPCT